MSKDSIKFLLLWVGSIMFFVVYREYPASYFVPDESLSVFFHAFFVAGFIMLGLMLAASTFVYLSGYRSSGKEVKKESNVSKRERISVVLSLAFTIVAAIALYPMFFS